MSIQRIADDFLNIRGSFRIGGLIDIGTHASLVRLANGASVNYDRLVLAPGIDLKFDSVPGYSEAASQQMPSWTTSRSMAAAFRSMVSSRPASDYGCASRVAKRLRPAPSGATAANWAAALTNRLSVMSSGR
mgnify:CR=1 FL=1